MNLTELKIEVLKIIDEVGASNNANTFNIEPMLKDTAKYLLNVAPLRLISKHTNFKTASTINLKDGSGEVTLPVDFIRLVSYKMDGWKRNVVVALDCESSEYTKQFNAITRAGIAKPKVFIRGNKIIYFSLPTSMNHKITEALCVCNIEPESDDFPQQLISPLLWITASKVLMISGDNESNLVKLCHDTGIEILSKL